LSDLFDRALLNLGKMSGHYGKLVTLRNEQNLPTIFAKNLDEFRFVLDALKNSGWISAQNTSSSENIQLTPPGWLRVAELEAQRVGDIGAQAFVAMWFGNNSDLFEGRRSCDWSLEAFRRGFEPGVERAGYRARRIDLKQYNDDVTDEIIAEIRGSRFVVADFTRHRPGVYYETGFARGLGLPVIFTCHQTEMKNAHFDTNHFNHVEWSSLEELSEKLRNRIVATLGYGPLTTPPRKSI